MIPRLAAPGSSSLRILMTADAVGGVWTYAADLTAALSAQGSEIVVAVLGPAPDFAQREALAGLPGVTLVETGLPLDWTAEHAGTLRMAAARVAGLAAEHGVDLVHLNTPALAGLAAFPAPVVAAAHSCLATWWHAVKGDAALPADFVWRHELTQRGLHAADAVIAPTRAFAEATRRAHGLTVPPLAVPNGRSAAPAPAHSGEAPRFFAFTAGRLWDAGKNMAAMDRAAARMRAPLLAAGPLDGPGSAVRLAHARPLGRLCEPVMRRWMHDAPVFVSAALYEPFGLTVLEAAQAGCALVLADIPTFRELWDGVAAFVPPHDDAALAEATEALVWDEPGRAARGRAARERAARFGTDAMAAGTLAVYRDALRAGTVRAAGVAA